MTLTAAELEFHGLPANPYPPFGGAEHLSGVGLFSTFVFDLYLDVTPTPPVPTSFFDVFFHIDIIVPPLPTPQVFPITLVSLQLQSVDPIPLDVGGVSYNVPILLRQTPGTSAMGYGRMDGPEHYRIDSFFDVFVELSVDDGNSWIPSQRPANIRTTPDGASTLGLTLAALAFLLGVRRRDRCAM